ncbi:MAG: xanthine dehydrogenase family protein molybdopterin-binding subunit, partial [Acidobacteriota bacterium]|nr:xanthine dehydrogenase family protein molybdopterin-binding subunit [Acidobacteriota bacterium]
MASKPKWVGQSLRRKEDIQLLTGRGSFADDLKFPNLAHAAILRSPHAHARIRSIDVSAARSVPGVIDVLTGAEIAELSKPFPAALPARMKFYSCAVDKARFVGEPVAVVIADNRYIAEDGCDRIQVDYEPLPVVTDSEKAIENGAPVLHEDLGTNLVNHRLLTYGDPDAAFDEADVVVSQKFYFHKYSSTPIETCVVVAKHDPATGVMTLWSNFHGPYSLHSFVSKGLNTPENKVRCIAPTDIGGSFGIKIGITVYMVLIGIAARKTGRTIKWVEDRQEHLLALSSGAERTAYYDMAAKNDGTILAVRAKYVDNNGAYIRAPEPANLYRTTGNTPGPYRIPNIQIDAHAIVTNKSPTGPNRGYGCQQLYYCLERMVDLLAAELDADPAEIRARNLIQADQFPYRTPTGGLYDSGDYPAGLAKALELADYAGLRKRQASARAEGRLFGIGIGLGVEPCVSNMGYLNISYPPEMRAKQKFHSKSGAGEAAVVKIDPMGQLTAILGSAPSGQGHEVLVAQVVGDELGVPPELVTVVSEMDTFTRTWTISSGNYSSRFASAGLSAFAEAGQLLKKKLVRVAAHHWQVPEDEVKVIDGTVRHNGSAEKSMTFRELAGLAHWNPDALPEGMEPGLQVTHLFNYAPS